jgi:hypothetical protein
VHPRCETLVHYFSCLCAPSVDPTKSVPGQITPNLCLCIQCVLWAQSVFWCIPGMKCRHTIFHVSVRPLWIPQKARWDTLHQTCNFAFGRICRSHSVLWCVQGIKRRCTIFQGRVGPVQILIKVHRDTLHRTCVFASSRICGSGVCSIASGALNVDALFLSSCAPGVDPTLKHRDTLR